MQPGSIRIRLLSFGPLRNRVPEGGLCRELTGNATVAALLAALRDEGIFSADALRSAAVAVNHEYAQPDHLLHNGDEVAILPPVSGGAPSDITAATAVSAARDALVQLITEPIDANSILMAIKSGGAGAVCVFDGIVRDNTRGRRTLYLDYEAYPEMALKQMRALRDDALTRFAIRDVAIIHRTGRLFVGETSVLIAVASAHRATAFDACRFLIDTLKKTIPIWKREHFADGAVWADGDPFPEDIVTGAAG